MKIHVEICSRAVGSKSVGSMAKINQTVAKSIGSMAKRNQAVTLLGLEKSLQELIQELINVFRACCHYFKMFSSRKIQKCFGPDRCPLQDVESRVVLILQSQVVANLLLRFVFLFSFPCNSRFHYQHWVYRCLLRKYCSQQCCAERADQNGAAPQG